MICKTSPKKLIAPFVLSCAMIGVTVWLRGWPQDGAAEIVIGFLTDLCTVPGILLSCVALLSWTATFGMFDMLGYGSRSFFGHFIPGLSHDLPHSFYEYRAQKDEKGRTWLKNWLVCGLFWLGLAIVFLVIYFMVS